MKLIRFILSKFTSVGIASNQSTIKWHINRRVIVVYSIYGCALTMSAAYLYYDANTFEEYTNNIYITTAFSVIIFIFTIFVLNMTKLFELVDNFGQLVERGEQCGFNVCSAKHELVFN